MRMPSFDTIIKYLIIVLNILFVLCGSSLIIFGVVLTSSQDLIDSIDIDVGPVQIALIVVGVIIFAIAAVGAYGFIKKNPCMLTTYGVALSVIAIIQLLIGVGVLLAFNHFDVRTVLRSTFFDRDPDSLQAFDVLQKTFECCGVDGPSDYAENNWTIPSSCCPDGNCDSQLPYTSGCSSAFSDWLRNIAKSTGGFAIGFAIVEFAVIVFACIHARRARLTNRMALHQSQSTNNY